MGTERCYLTRAMIEDPVVKEIRKDRRGGWDSCRLIIYWRMLGIFSETPGLTLGTPGGLATLTHMPESQCKRVWDLCVGMGVLVSEGDEYRPAPEYLPREDAPSPVAAPAPVPKKERPWKERARFNVWLTREEILALGEKYTPEQIENILDKLSEYKAQNKRSYASDYDAIIRWAYKWADVNPGKQDAATDEFKRLLQAL